MKKFFSFWMAAALLVGVGALTACGNDDDEAQNSAISQEAAALVGTWRSEIYYGGYLQYTLNADGTGVYREVDLEYGEDYIEPFRWSYDATMHRLIVTYGTSYDSETEVFEVISSSQSTVILGIWDDGELHYEELYRVK